MPERVVLMGAKLANMEKEFLDLAKNLNKVSNMYSTGLELFEDSESYLSELNDDNFDSPIDGFNVIHRSMFESFDIAADISLAAINIAALAVSSPDCGVSLKLTKLIEVSVTRCNVPILISECRRKLVD
jgi:hypothetical protein